MIIKKGTLLKVEHKRKGSFTGIAIEDFDTEKEEFYPIAVAQEKIVRGMAEDWERGEKISCRAEFCKIELIKKKGGEKNG